MARIFISYSRADRQFVDSFVPLIRRVYGNDSVWYDDDIHGGSNWWMMILRQVAQCDLFIYLISNESLASPYCQAELREALRLRKQVLPVIVRPKTHYPGAIADDLQPVLRRTQYVDMSRGFRDVDVVAQLYAAINRLLEAVPPAAPTPLDSMPVSEPPVPDKPTPKRRMKLTEPWAIIIAALLTGIFAIIAALIALNGGGDDDANSGTDPTRTGQDVSAAISETPTSDSAATDTPPPVATETPTLSGFQELQTTEAQMTRAAETRVALDLTATEDGLLSGNATATAALIAATETAARQTLIALSATATPTPRPTSTPTPTPQPTATSTPPPPTRTPTPRPTATSTPPPPTRTPTPDPTLQLAQTPVARNADWTPVVKEFDGVEMVLVPAGCFEMGSEDGDSDEDPAHRVCFDEPFWIDRTEVTQAQFAAFDRQAGNSSYFTGDDRPREQITWTEAQAFCELREARLPTEAEWEYAARGPDGLVYPWGDAWDAENANWDGTSPDETFPVGSFPAGVSWVGAQDMSGNVWEWVADWYGADYYGTLAEGVVNPQGPGTGEYRVLRGGSFYNTSGFLRAAHRSGDRIELSLYGGFRCARSR